MKNSWILGIIGSLIVVLLGGIGAKVWEGVEIAKENSVHIEHVREKQKEEREERRELREDLNSFMGDMSDLAARVEYTSDHEH